MLGYIIPALYIMSRLTVGLKTDLALCRTDNGQWLSTHLRIIQQHTNTSSSSSSSSSIMNDTSGDPYLMSMCRTCLNLILMKSFPSNESSDLSSLADLVRSKCIGQSHVCEEHVTQCCLAARDCCLLQLQAGPTLPHHCPVTWDGLSCVGPAAPGTTVLLPCPRFVSIFIEWRKASKICDKNGTWHRQEKNGTVKEPTSYNNCMMVENEIAIAYVSISVLALSILLLLVSISLFLGFRSLRRQPRIQIHTNLFIALLLKSLCELITTSILDVSAYSIVAAGSATKSILYSSASGCKWITILTRYFQNCSFCWMLCEALFLYHLLFRAFARISGIKLYLFVGWVIPFIYTSIYVLIRDLHPSYVNQNNQCWVEETPPLEYVLKGPNILSLFLNVVFLFNIIRLIRNMPTQPSDRSDWYHTLKSVVILVPLFGLQLLVVAVYISNKSPAYLPYSIFQSIIQDSQGLAVSLAFCAFNLEVRNTVRRRFHRIVLHLNLRHQSGTGPAFIGQLEPHSRISSHTSHISGIHSGSRRPASASVGSSTNKLQLPLIPRRSHPINRKL